MKDQEKDGTFDNFVKESLISSDQVQQEDNDICESVQRGLESSAYDTGRYAPNVRVKQDYFKHI